jgi:hypothetical protein
MKVGRVLTMAMLVASSAQGAEDVAAPLAPSGNWVMDSGENSCAIWSKFSAGPNSDVSFGVEPATLTEVVTLSVVVPDGSGKRKGKAARIVLVPSGQLLTISSDRHGALPGGDSAARLIIKRSDLPALFAATSLTVEFGDVGVSIAPPVGQDVTKTLQACETNLMTKWGVDPAEFAAAAVAPKLSNMQTVFRPEDYPRRPTNDSVLGASLTIVKVGIDGKVAVCRTIASGGDASVDAAICSTLTQRAVFEPALDRNGNAIAGWWSRKVRWPMPQ